MASSVVKSFHKYFSLISPFTNFLLFDLAGLLCNLFIGFRESKNKVLLLSPVPLFPYFPIFFFSFKFSTIAIIKDGIKTIMAVIIGGKYGYANLPKRIVARDIANK